MTLSLLKTRPLVALPLLFAFISLLVFACFRTVPVTRLWKDYDIFYVYSDELSEDDVSYILKKNGCENVIFKGSQRNPVVSPLSPVQPQKQNSYIYERNGFFTDKSKTAHVFYVPDRETKNLEKAALEISSFQSTVCGTDGKTPFPWISPLIALTFAFVLFHFAHEKRLFALTAVFPLVLAFSRPLYTVSASSVFLLFTLFLIQKIWNRRDFRKTVLKSPYAVVPALSPFLILIFSSPVNVLFYALAVFASCCVIKFFKELDRVQDESFTFRPVLIMSSRMIPLVGHNGIRLMGLMSLVLGFLVLLFFFIGKVQNIGNNTSAVSLPSPVSQDQAELPGFQDFLSWSWNTVTFPYRRISSSAEKVNDGDTVSIPDYLLNGDDFITETDSNLLVYDSKFRDSISDTVEKLEYPALEKMLLKQGKNSFYGYSQGKISSSERFGAYLLIAFVLICAALSGYYIAGRKRYGLSI